jgi:hypothetical protein
MSLPFLRFNLSHGKLTHCANYKPTRRITLRQRPMAVAGRSGILKALGARKWRYHCKL